MADVALVIEREVGGDPEQEAARIVDRGGVARRIAQAHGGDLSAANRPAGGAELTGWLGILFRVD